MIFFFLTSLFVSCPEGVSDAAAGTADAVKEEAQGPNPFVVWIEFIRSSVLSINSFYKGAHRISGGKQTKQGRDGDILSMPARFLRGISRLEEYCAAI